MADRNDFSIVRFSTDDLPEKDRATGQRVYPKPAGVVEILEQRGFQSDQPAAKIKGNIHFEEYW